MISTRLLLAFPLLVLGCPSDDDGGGDTGADSDEHNHPTESTADEHGAEEHGGEEHGASSGDHDHSVDTSADDPAVVYCSCMLANCHDTYHGKWGEDEMAAEQACLMEADGLPMNGEDIEMGNFIECRAHFCELAADDESLCENAIGDAVCM